MKNNNRFLYNQYENTLTFGRLLDGKDKIFLPCFVIEQKAFEDGLIGFEFKTRFDMIKEMKYHQPIIEWLKISHNIVGLTLPNFVSMLQTDEELICFGYKEYVK